MGLFSSRTVIRFCAVLTLFGARIFVGILEEAEMANRRNKEKELNAETKRRSVGGVGVESPKEKNRNQAGGVTRLDKFLQSPGVGRGQKEKVKEAQQKKVETMRGDGEEEQESHATGSWEMLSQIMQGVEDTNGTLKEMRAEIGAARTDITLIRDDLKRIRERIGEIEERLGEMEDKTVDWESELKRITVNQKTMQDKLIDLEDRSRRKNLRVIGFPEKSEGANCEEFMEKWLQESYPTLNSLKNFGIERAHRVPFKMTPPGSSPRTILVKLYSSRDRDILLRKSREEGDKEFNGAKIAIYPDYSKTTQEARMKFVQVKRRLRQAGITYSLVFPAKLRVVHQEKVIFFTSAPEASEWIDTRGM